MKTLVVDFGGTRVKWGLFANEELEKKGFVRSDYLYSISDFREFLKDFKFDRLVLGFAGMLENGIVIHAPNLPRWEGLNLYEEFKEYFPIIENDANLFILGEYHYGAAKGYKIAVGITLGTGVGGGVVIDGKLLRGKNGFAGELGHICIDINGPPCNCGSFGCAESFLGEAYFVERARRVFIRFGQNPPTDMKALEDKARMGSSLAKTLWDEYGRYLGVLISNIISVFDPGVIVLGGGISNAYDLFEESMKREILKRKVAYKVEVPVLKAKLEHSALYGGVYLANLL
ncbi:MAG: ROK family protein [candidate division WOR-3 bacterium]